jgi:hypothetical protein
MNGVTQEAQKAWQKAKAAAVKEAVAALLKDLQQQWEEEYRAEQEAIGAPHNWITYTCTACRYTVMTAADYPQRGEAHRLGSRTCYQCGYADMLVETEDEYYERLGWEKPNRKGSAR